MKELFRFRTTTAALLLLSAFGCASWLEGVGGHEAVMDSWMGSDINDLMKAWGHYSEKGRLPDGSPTYTWTFGDRCSTTMITDRQGRITHANSLGCYGMGLPKGPGKKLEESENPKML